MVNKDIKFLQQAIRDKSGKRIRVWYNQGNYTKESKIPKNAITIYSREYGSSLPKELKAENDTDSQTDYFDKDRARVHPRSKYFKDVLSALKKQEAFAKKINDRKKIKYGWN